MSFLNSEFIIKFFPEKNSDFISFISNFPILSLNEKSIFSNSKFKLETNGLIIFNSKLSFEIFPFKKVLSSMLISELITFAIFDLIFKLKLTSSSNSIELKFEYLDKYP